MDLTRDQITIVQKALRSRGYLGADERPLMVDGLWGPNTSYAVRDFKRSNGLRDRDYIGPITWAKIVNDGTEIVKKLVPATKGPAWYAELLAMIGKHEDLNNAQLRLWLRSDGMTVGDPARIPWCGDAVQTAIKLVLPTEPIPENPYLAANWVKFGQSVKPQLGAVLSFWRGTPSSWKGHVGFYAGESSSNYYVLGGNQGDRVSIAPISKKRLRPGGSRWPVTGIEPMNIYVNMSGGTVSTNEA